MTLEELWLSRFKRQKILYNACGTGQRDPRTFLLNRSYVLEKIVKLNQLRGKDNHDTMLRCCNYVQDKIKYVSDMKSVGLDEYWRTPEETVDAGLGDCDCGALLLKSLTLIAGIPDWRVKVVFGLLFSYGAHMYCAYIRDSGSVVIVDWCEKENRLPMSERTKVGHDNKYGPINFAFDYTHTYSGQSDAFIKY
jgi:predicted transglutaminase-like cysteine proteinase